MSPRRTIALVPSRDPVDGELIRESGALVSVDAGFEGLAVQTPEGRLLVVEHPELGGTQTPAPEEVAARLDPAPRKRSRR